MGSRCPCLVTAFETFDECVVSFLLCRSWCSWCVCSPTATGWRGRWTWLWTALARPWPPCTTIWERSSSPRTDRYSTSPRSILHPLLKIHYIHFEIDLKQVKGHILSANNKSWAEIVQQLVIFVYSHTSIFARTSLILVTCFDIFGHLG